MPRNLEALNHPLTRQLSPLGQIPTDDTSTKAIAGVTSEDVLLETGEPWAILHQMLQDCHGPATTAGAAEEHIDMPITNANFTLITIRETIIATDTKDLDLAPVAIIELPKVSSVASSH